MYCKIFGLLLILWFTPPTVGKNLPKVPKGLDIVDWGQIRAEYERHRHGAFTDGAGLRARNFGQQWLARFDGRGVSVEPHGQTWRWGLELAGVSGKARVSTEVNRVTYRWNDALDEWYVNGTRGLEHGFTLRTPHPVRLTVRGPLRARATAAGVEFVDADGTARVKYTELAAWDSGGKAVPARMRVEGGSVVLALDDRGARYPVTIDPIVQQAYLKASNTAASDYFGWSVAVSGDTVVVGAHQESSNATGVNGDQSNNSASVSGAAYVFVRSGVTWAQQAYLKASNSGTVDAFGWSVAVSGDTVVVGAVGEASNVTGVNGDQSNNSATDSGAAYVFVRSGVTWTQQAYLKASNTEAGDRFGFSVAVSGDTVVVGADLEDSNATGVNGDQSNNSSLESGAVYVFARNGATWTQQAYLKASNTGVRDSFGVDVAVSGDTVVVGAPNEDSNATGVNGNQSNDSASTSGAAYVFVRNGVTWTQQAYLKASNTGASDVFGASLGVSGDTVVVGALNESSNATGVNGDQSNNSALNSGAAYVFVRSGVTWTQQAYLKASNTGASDDFGISVEVSGDTVAVGARFESSNATGVNGDQSNNSSLNSGAAYVFVRSGVTWTQQAYLKASNTGADDFFGASLALSGDTVVVGAYQEASNATGVNGDQSNNSASISGAAYAFFQPPTSAVNLSNWGFETPIQSANGFTQGPFGNLNTGWYHDSFAGVTANNSALTSANAPAPEGNQAAFILGTGSISQLVGGFQPGLIYRMAFKMAERVNFAQQSIQITMTGTSALAAPIDLGTYTFAPGNPAYQQFVTPSFSLQSNAGLLMFQGLASQDGTAFIDDVVIYDVTSTVTPCSYSFNPAGSPVGATGGSSTFLVTVTGGCFWTAASSAAWLTVTFGSPGSGNGTVGYSFAANSNPTPRVASINIGGHLFTVIQAASPIAAGLRFVPVTPCRIADTRNPIGALGGPPLAGGVTRDFSILAGPCGIPENAAAYSLNLTVVPLGPLGFLSVWPAGQVQPTVSTLNSSDGRIKANAAIVPAGTNGAITLFASHPTHAIIDINGYFVPASGNNNLAFYAVTPCRIADTRGAAGTFGGPSLPANTHRDFPVLASGCGIPASAQAYALNMTVVPSAPLGFLSVWPAGQPQPGSSTLNAPTGAVVANAAIVPAPAGGAITVIATHATHVIVDINGYFAPPGAGGMQFYTATPCRIADTRGPAGAFGGPRLEAAAARSFVVPASGCGIPSGAGAYSLNATVAPPAGLGFLSLWGAGSQPGVSTLNASDGSIVANAALAPASAGGAVTAIASHATHLILDINGYFAQ